MKVQPESALLDIALARLLAALEAGKGKAQLQYDEVQGWGQSATEAFLGYGLIQPVSSANKIECVGCEERCYTDVVLQGQGTDRMRAFVVCEVPHKQAEMGRVAVQLERLQQWAVDSRMLARFMALQLGLEPARVQVTEAGVLRLGMVPSPRGRRWVSLLPSPLALEINQQRVPVNEVLFAGGGEISLDELRIQAMLAKEPEASGKAYTPSTDGRESRKQQTQAMYQDWHDAYVKLIKQHPNRPKTWYAHKISRLEIAKGKSSETIRKRLP
ncbi:MAG: hypothetical protein WDZ52_02705 [Pseudohongiellaceae bacterium]